MACNGMRRRVLGLCLGLSLGLGLAGLLPQGAAAETLTRPAAGIGDWIVMAGRLQLQPDGWFVATSGGQRAPFSSGNFLFNEPVESPYVLTVTARRPDNLDRPIEIAFLGGYFAVAGTDHYFWEREGHWTDWVRNTHPAAEEYRIIVVQEGARVTAYVNGIRVGQFVLEDPVTATRVGMFFKAPPAQLAQMQFRDFSVVQGDAALARARALEQAPSSP